MARLAILAGRGPLPATVAERATEKGWDVLILAFEGFADLSYLTPYASISVRLGEVGKILRILRQQKCQDLVMIGAVDRPNWRDLHLDGLGWRLLGKWGVKLLGGDNQLLSLIVNFFTENGFHVIGADRFLKTDKDQLLRGILSKKLPTAQQRADATKALQLMRALGPYDVGQACAIQNGVVLAIEAMEGTDNMIYRAGQVRQPGDGGIVVKCAKPHQETRVDMPVIGVKTLLCIHQAGLVGLVFDPQNCLLIEPQKCIEQANASHIFLWGRN